MPKGSTVGSVEALQAQLAARDEELRQLRASIDLKQTDFTYLGEIIPSGVLAEITRGGALSDRAARSAGPGMHHDGRGLYLQKKRRGASWIFRPAGYLGLGGYPAVGLAEARGRAAVCRMLLARGVDPAERRQALGARTPAHARRVATTFREAADRFYESKKAGWRSEKTALQFVGTMRDYVYPVVGDWPVGDVDVNAVLKILEPLWTTKPETASRVRARVEQVLDWARALKLRTGENPAAWKGSLKALLPARSKVRAVEHHAALPFQDMYAFWTSLAPRSSTSAEALKFTILTAARTSEVLGARWSEIDIVEKSWTVPASRMKGGRQHRVALSAEAIKILENLQALRSNDEDFLFPGAKRGKALSQMAMSMCLRKLGRSDLTVHGFRSTFRDWAAEATAYPGDLAELALSHAIGNKVEAAYRRGDQFERRRRLMQDWAKLATTPAALATAESNVTPIGATR